MTEEQLQAECVTDPGTLRRVASALRADLRDVPAICSDSVLLAEPGGYLERRTVTPLRHVRGDGR